MKTKAISHLLVDLVTHPALKEGEVKGQIPKLFIPSLWGSQVHDRDSLIGRITAFLSFFTTEEAQEQKLYSIFNKALHGPHLVKSNPKIKQLHDELNPFSKLKNPELESLEGQFALNTLAIEENLEQYSLLKKPSKSNQLVDKSTFRELFGFNDPTEKSRKYWSQFLDRNPKFQHPLFKQHEELLSSAQKYSKEVSNKLTGPDKDRILQTEAQFLADEINKLKGTGKSWMYSGTYGPKVNSLKTLFRLIDSQHHDYTDWIPKLLKEGSLFEDPKKYVINEIRRTLKDQANQLSPEQEKILQLLAEDPTREIPEELKNKIPLTLQPMITAIARNGILGNLEKLAVQNPSHEVLNLLRLLISTPGIDTYIITGLFFNLFGMMQWLPQDKMLEVTQWVSDNATGLAHLETRDKTLEDLEKFIGSLIDIPIEKAIEHVKQEYELTLKTAYRGVMTPEISEALFEMYALDYPLAHAPYWFKLEPDAHGTFTAYIYSSGHALNNHTHENGQIQWPMRISYIPSEKLNAPFFERLLMHQFKSDYDLNFMSKADDLFGKNGTFTSLRSKTDNHHMLERRPFHQTFDSEWELLQAGTTQGNHEHASLFMHIAALNDFLSAYKQSSGGYDLSREKDGIKLLQNSLKILKREFEFSSIQLDETEKTQMYWTLYQLEDIIRVEKEREIKTIPQAELLPPFMVSWLKNLMLSSHISSKHILQYRHTVGWLFGKEIADAIEVVLNSADATTATDNLILIENSKKNALSLINSVEIQDKMAALKQTFENFEENPIAFFDQLNELETFDLTTIHQLTLDNIPKDPESKQVRKYIQAFLNDVNTTPGIIRLRNLELARVLIKKQPKPHSEAMSLLNKLSEDLVVSIHRLNETRQLRAETKRLLKSSQQHKVSSIANDLFKTIGLNKLDEETRIQLVETSKSFKFLDQAVLSYSALQAAKVQLCSLELCIDASNPKLLNEISQLHDLLKERLTIESSFTPSKGWLRDSLANIYVKTVLHLINITFSLEHWMSPFTFFSLCEATIGILPKPIGNFIDYYSKFILRFIIEKIFFLTLHILTEKHCLEPKSVEILFSLKEHINSLAASFTGKRRVSYEISESIMGEDPNREHLDKTDHIRPLLMPFTRFCPIEKISATDNATHLTHINFSPYNLSFAIKNQNGTLRAVNEALFNDYAIAENQEDPNLIRYGSYLVLENSNEKKKKKVLLPTGADSQAISWRLLQKLGPIAGLLGNVMGIPQQKYILPHRGHSNHYYSYNVDSQGHLVSDDPAATAYLLSIELMIGCPERADHACEQFLSILKNTPDIPDISTIEMMLWPLAVTPKPLQKSLAHEETGNLFQIRQKIFAALEEKMLPHAEIEAEANALIATLQEKKLPIPKVTLEASALIAQSILQDLHFRSKNELSDRDCRSKEEKEREEWFLYKSLQRHMPNLRKLLINNKYTSYYTSMLMNPAYQATVNNVLSFDSSFLTLTPAMGRRQAYLEDKYGNSNLNIENRAIHFIRDVALSPSSVQVPRSIITNNGINLANFEILDSEIPKERLTSNLYKTVRTQFDCLSDPKINWIELAKSIEPRQRLLSLSTENLNRESLVKDFVSYYCVARGEEGWKRQQELRQLLQTKKGGWDRTSRVLIEILFVVSNPPTIAGSVLGCRTIFSAATAIAGALLSSTNDSFASSGDIVAHLLSRNDSSINSLFTKIAEKALEMQTANLASRPLHSLASSALKTAAFWYTGAAKALFPIGFHLISRVANVVRDNLEANTMHNSVVPQNLTQPLDDTYRKPKLEEDKIVNDVLAQLYDQSFDASGHFRSNQSKDILYDSVTKHSASLNSLFENDKKTLLNLVNPQRMFDAHRKPVTYKELLKCFFRGDFDAISKEVSLDPTQLERAMLRLVVRETRIQQMKAILHQLETLNRTNRNLDGVYKMQLNHIRFLLKNNHQFGDSQAETCQDLRRFLCYELGQGSFLTSNIFPSVKSNLLNNSYFDKFLTQTLINY